MKHNSSKTDLNGRITITGSVPTPWRLNGGFQVCNDHDNVEYRPRDTLIDVSDIDVCPAVCTPVVHNHCFGTNTSTEDNVSSTNKCSPTKILTSFANVDGLGRSVCADGDMVEHPAVISGRNRGVPYDTRRSNNTILRVGLPLMLLAHILLPRVSAFDDDCRHDQHYDKNRQVCMDLCGRDNRFICPVEEFCSSHDSLAQQFDPPFCVPRCIVSCYSESYCHHGSTECRPCDTLCDGSDMDACRAYCYDVFITLSPTVPQPPWKTCSTDQYHDTKRMVCLDRCGVDNTLICSLEDFCSSNQLWSEQFDPPFCLNRCIQACDKTSYCDHSSALCRPCDTLCDGSDMDACRAYCYDIYITSVSTTPQPPRKPCNVNQYYDLNREVCLDRCGVEKEEKCGVDQFCSTTVTWGVKIRPPACLNHCSHSCDEATYCDSISHLCLSCDYLCDGSKIDMCRIHCYDVFMNETSIKLDNATGSTSIMPVYDTVFSTDIWVSGTKYQWIVCALIIIIILIVLIAIITVPHCQKISSVKAEYCDVERNEEANPLKQFSDNKSSKVNHYLIEQNKSFACSDG